MRGGGYQRVEVLTGPGRRRVWDEATKGKRQPSVALR
jgi:transposase